MNLQGIFVTSTLLLAILILGMLFYLALGKYDVTRSNKLFILFLIMIFLISASIMGGLL